MPGRERETNGTQGAAAGHPVLRNINLKIPAGSTLAIVGPTGSGKTTLAALIARLWEAPNGAALDRRPADPRMAARDILRRAIGYVPQDTYLFSETVGGNIAFGLAEFDAAQSAAKPPKSPISTATSKPSRQVRHGGRRTRHHSFGRTKAAHRHCTRASFAIRAF